MMVNAANHTTVNQGLRRSSNVRYVRLHIAQIFHFIILNIEKLKLFPEKDAVILKKKFMCPRTFVGKTQIFSFWMYLCTPIYVLLAPPSHPMAFFVGLTAVFHVSTNILIFYENAFVWNGTFYKIVYMYMFWNKEIHMPSVL